MRNLASIQKISKLEPIPNADTIEKATVLGWELVVKKGEFKEGDLCVYCEIDSVLPERPEFEFLRTKKFRIKTIKFKGQISQGICFPLSILPDDIIIEEGKDVTEILNIEKYEPPQELKMAKQVNKIQYPEWTPQWLQKIMHKFSFIRNYYRKHSHQKSFPSLIPKTDETRVQILQPLLDKYVGTLCYYTEKLDGSSITIYKINGKFGVCSRNLDLHKNKSNKYWETVLEHDLERKIKKNFGKTDIVLQGELIGEGIQANKYKLKGRDIYFFNIYFPKQKRYGSYEELLIHCSAIGEKTVPLLNDNYILTNSIPDLVKISDGKSLLANIPREGIVIRPSQDIIDNEFGKYLIKQRVSFKVVNPKFLLKYGE